MPNPILRAGPFRFGSNFFAEDNGDPECHPVNCANARSTRWPWRVRKVTNGTPSVNEVLISGVSSFENSFSFYADFPSVAFRFSYQAATQWSFSGSTYSASFEEGSLDFTSSINVDVFVGGSLVFSDDTETVGLASISGDFDSIVFPASVVPRYVEIFFIGGFFSSGTGSGELSGAISLPILTA